LLPRGALVVVCLAAPSRCVRLTANVRQQMRGQLAIGAFGILVGMALMLTGQSMCRTQCWIDSVWRMLLPESFASIAGGLSWVFIGIGIVGWSLLNPRTKKREDGQE
jgi:hypothetical protein